MADLSATCNCMAEPALPVRLQHVLGCTGLLGQEEERGAETRRYLTYVSSLYLGRKLSFLLEKFNLKAREMK